MFKKNSPYPSTAQSVKIRATDTTVSDLDIDIGLLPWLRLEFLPDHFSLGGVRAEAYPSFELIIGRHDMYKDVINLRFNIIYDSCKVL
jgi:hypothetical protein